MEVVSAPVPAGERPGVEDLARLIRNYYEHPAVRQRILEFAGQSPTSEPTAVYVTGTEGTSDPCAWEPFPIGRLDELFARGYEIGRSLWDHNSLIADVDLDYENFDSAAEPYVHPDRSFHIMQPVVDAAIEVLETAGIRPLHTIGGRGHHLVWAIRYDSAAFDQLAALGKVPSTLMSLYDRSAAAFGHVLHPCQARAFSGLGMLLEFAAHRILRMAAPRCRVPIQLTAVEVGPVGGRREIVVLDISEYGDPLHLRHIRVPFSVYLKPQRLEWCLGEEGVRQLLPLFEIPLDRIFTEEALRIRGDPQAVSCLAARTSARIPDQSEGTLNLLHNYKKSELADFHYRFYADQPETGDRIESSANSDAPEMLPSCTRWILEHPNDWLLKPGGVQHATRTLMALGWAPRDIAELVQFSYEGDFDWGDRWRRYDPASRALFYVRLFAGLIETGEDRLIDFNCVSHQEKGYCTIADCTRNLVPYQQALIARREHGRLGNRHLHGLLLEDKDL